MKKQKIIVILGPTASGKTALALNVAQQFNGEVINADSRTVYKEMNIGTAKPEFEIGHESGVEGKIILKGVVHWGFDLVNPDEHFQAMDFKRFADATIADILERGKLPIIAGGTGLYIQGVVDNFDFEGGVVGEQKYNVLQIGIRVDREELYRRINFRVDEMIALGLVSEVKQLKDKYGCSVKSMTGIGYRQICQYLGGDISLEQAIELIKRDTRRYAKRQMTWFKRDKRIKWITDFAGANILIKDCLNKKTENNSVFPEL